jgi:glucan phosphoethanolaminetransferase (alkaline phosphatase superfamily)
MLKLCPPAIIYLIFSVTQILIDTFKGLYNTAFVKIIVATMVTLLLNILCERGLGVVSWIIVFIPFILMTVIVSVILYTFGLDASTGTLGQSQTQPITKCNTDELGNIIVYDPNYDPVQHPVYYQSPNITIPNPSNNTQKINQVVLTSSQIPIGSSSPAYQ